MKCTFGIFSSVLHLLLCTRTPLVQGQSCPSETNCEYEYNEDTQTDFTCGDTVQIAFFTLPTCVMYFGGALTIQPIGFEVIGLVDSPYDKVCDYYTPETTVPTCLNANGTYESRLCAAAIELVYHLRNNCTLYFVLQTELIPPLGQAAIAYRNDPTNNCRPSVAPGNCTKGGSPSAKLCPRCQFQQCP